MKFCRYFLMLAWLACPALSHAQFTFITNSGAITITGYTGTNQTVVVPASTNGYPVTTIGANAFKLNTTITNVTLPSSITILGDSAFAQCVNLKGIYFLGNVPTLQSSTVFTPGTVLYYVNGRTGWPPTLGGCTTAVWLDPNFVYTAVNGSTITLTSYSGGRNAVIPATLFGLPVTSLVGTFSSLTAVTNVTIPNTVTNLGDNTFYSCTRLTNVYIPASVVSIGQSAFASSGLTNIVIPDSVTSLGQSAFQACVKLTSATIGNGITNLPAQAFFGCSLLKSVTFGTNLISIGSKAFANCVQLTNVFIPATVTNIGASAFTGCPQLKSVYFLGNAPLINSQVFDNTTTVYYLPGTTGWTNSYGGASTAALAFPDYNCTVDNGATVTITKYIGNSSSVIVPAAMFGLPVTRIGSYAFMQTSVTDVGLPDSVTAIDSAAFSGCFGLTAMTFGNNNVTLSDSVFQGCTSLKTLTHFTSVTSIGADAFYSCYSLSNLTFGAGFTNFGDAAFFNCTGLTNAVINEGVTALNSSLFSGCGRLKSVTLPNSLLAIGDNVFLGCSNLLSAPLPNNVTNIGLSAFQNCAALTNVIIPDSVRHIADQAFASCTQLRSVVVGNGVTDLAVLLFYNCPSLTNVVMADSLVSIKDGAFRDCSALKQMLIGSNVTTLVRSAFNGCSALTNLTVNAANPVYSSLGGVLFDKLKTTLLLYPAGLPGGYTVPNGVAAIGGAAFLNSVLMTNVTLPATLASIGTNACQGCTNLPSITLPAGVTNVGLTAFIYSGVTNISVDAANPVYSSLSGLLLDKAQTTLIRFPAAITGSYTLPTNITSIASYAFSDCTGLTNLVLPPSVINLGSNAFYGCAQLASMTIQASGVSLSGNAFAGCPNLVAVYFQAGLPSSVGYNLFVGTPARIYYVNGRSDWQNFNSGNFGVLVSPWPSPDYSYVLVADTYVQIGRYTGAATSSLDIPAKLFGYPVVELGGFGQVAGGLQSLNLPDTVLKIDDSAFYGNALTNLTIGTNVISIGVNAFYMNQLPTLTIPDSVQSIGSGAFASSSALTNVFIGSGVTNIGTLAFGSCRFLANISVDPNNPAFMSDKGVLYDKAQTSLLVFPPAINGSLFDSPSPSIKSFVIPASVTSIAPYAFYDLISANLYFEGDKPSIGANNTFFYSDLSKVYFLTGTAGWDTPLSGVATLAWPYPDFTYRVVNGTNMTITSYTGSNSDVTIPTNMFGRTVTSIGTLAFQRGDVTNVFMTNGIKNIEPSAFSGSTGLGSIFIPDTVTNIGYSGFSGCYALTNIITGSNSQLANIDASAFAFCYYLPTLTLPNSVTNIGQSAFAQCTNLGSVMIPDSVRSLGPYAFSTCFSLTNVVLSRSFTTIPEYAFESCLKLKTLDIPANVTSISNNAFQYCNNLTSMTFSNHVASIGDSAFLFCTNLTGVVIGDNVTNIGESAFQNCYGLKNIAIPNGVISGSAFYYCTNLTNVFFGNGVTWIQEEAFYNCTSLKKIFIPNNIVSVDGGAFESCPSLTNVVIGNGVTQLGFRTFRDSALTNAFFLGNAPAFSGTVFAFPTTVYYLANTTGWGSTYSGATAVKVYPDLSFAVINGNELMVTGYNGSGGQVVIPSSIFDVPVTAINDQAFANCSTITSVIISNGITRIGGAAFAVCVNLQTVKIPASVSYIGNSAFAGCFSLNGLYFAGNRPDIDVGAQLFNTGSHAIVYYAAGSLGWGPTFSGNPTALFYPYPVVAGGAVASGHFGFNLNGPANSVMVVEACTNMSNPVWVPIATNTLSAGGASTFSDPQSMNVRRYYRLSSPQ